MTAAEHAWADAKAALWRAICARNPQLSFGALEEGVDRADGGSAAAPSSSASGVLVAGDSEEFGSGESVTGGLVDAGRVASTPGPPRSPATSAPSDGNPRGHPPDDQRIPALSPSGRGRDSGALDLTTSGPPAPPPKEDSGRAEGGHSK